MAYNSSPLDTSPTSTQGPKAGGDLINANFTEIPNMLALKEDKVKRTVTTTDPTVNDDSSQGYSVWSLWANTTTSEVYRCIDVTVGAAKWEKTTLTIDELGGAALLDVGTTTGTVAAGDDSRFLTDLQKTDLTDSGESTLHYHASDRARANHTGTQTLSTISDAGTAAAANIGTATGEVIGTDEAREYFDLEYEPSVLPTISSDFSRNKHELYEQYGNEPKTILQTWATTRATTGTYRDAAGVIRTAGIDEPRIDYDPVTGRGALLVEEARTNLLTYSEQFDNAAWSKTNASITANAAFAPDGTLTADTMDETATTGVHLVRQTTTVVANTTHTETIFVKYKSGGIERVRLDIADDTNTNNTVFVNYNLLTDTVSEHNAGTGSGAVVSFTKYNDGWVRIRISGIFNTVGTSVRYTLYAYGPDNTSLSYAGSTSRGVYIWGAQLEAASTPSSYIPTVASQVTRSADNVSRVLGDEFNPSEGVIYWEGDIPPNSVTSRITEISDGTTTKRLNLNKTNTNTYNLYHNAGGVNVTSSPITGAVKIAVRYSPTTMSMFINGTKIGETAITLSTGLNQLRLGWATVSGSINGVSKNLKYIPRALSDADLQEMTKL